jgi:peptide/nickel transport system substrate-binding protein
MDLAKKKFRRMRVSARRAAGVVVVLSTCGVLGGLAAQSSGAAAAKQATAASGSTLTFDRSSDIFGFDPVVDGDQTSISTDLQVFDRLVEQSQNGKTIVPGLATSWSQSANGLVYTFDLRKGVRFSNGQPMTSADVVFCLTRGTKFNTPYGVLFGNAIKKISARGPDTVVITLSHRFSPLIASLSTFIGSIYSEANFKKWGKLAGQHPIGTGAYELKQWLKGNQVTLVKNPYYWGSEKPTVDTLIFKDVSDPTARVLQLESGAAQAIDTVSPSQAAQLKQSGMNVDEVYGPSIQLVYLNEKFKPFANLDVRLALAYSMDRTAIAQAAFQGLAKPAPSAFPSGTYDFDPNYGLSYNMAAAKQELQKSPYAKGFSFQLIVPPGATPQSTFAQIWAAALKKIGVTLKIVPLEQTTGYQKWTSQTYEASTNPSYVNDTPDAFEFSLFMTTAQNAFYTGWHSPQAIALAKAAQSTSNAATRQKDYDAIQKLVSQQAPVIPVVDLPVIYASSPKLSGFSPSPNGRYFIEQVRESK